MRSRHARYLFLIGLSAAVLADPATTPRALVNYQGVLRDAADKPRVRIVAAAYAMNASTAQSAVDAANLAGRTPSDYLDTSATFQAKSGGLRVQVASLGTAGVFSNSVSRVDLATNSPQCMQLVPTRAASSTTHRA